MKVHTLCFYPRTISDPNQYAHIVIGVYMSDNLAHTAMRDHFFAMDGWNNEWKVTELETAPLGKLYRAYDDCNERLGTYGIREIVLR